MTNKRNIKKRKLKLTPLGQKVVGLSAIVLTATTLLTIGIANKAVSADQKENNIPTIETIQTEMEDIFEVNNLSPIINETVIATPTPEVIPTETIATPTQIEEVIETIAPTEEVIETIEETNQIINNSSFEIPASNINLDIGYSSIRNTSEDINKYNTVRENYGEIIDRIALETRWDPRLITAIIAQENPYNQDQTFRGIYGITSTSSIHNGQTYGLGTFDQNGDHQIIDITVDINRVNTDAEYAIYVQLAILQDYLRPYNISVDGTRVFGAYNGGPGSIAGGNLTDSINYFLNGTDYPHDREYYSNVFYKLNALSFEGIDDLYFTNLDGETASFDITFVDEPSVVRANTISNSHTL